MKKLLTILFLSVVLIIPRFVLATETINLYFFYGDGCPHCAKEEKFLNKLEENNKNIKVLRYEVWHNSDNAKILSSIAKELNLKIAGVPVLIIGEETVIGYQSDATTGQKILSILDKYKEQGCEDRVAQILDTDALSQCQHGCAEDDSECRHDCGCSADTVKNGSNTIETINLPFVGEINLKSFSLPALTMTLGALDGFNPCAMWTLLFLISLLLGMENRKKMWFLGGAFIFVSGFVYFLFLSAWLNLFLFLGFLIWIRITIGSVAILSGAYHLKEYWKNKNGTCHVTANENRRKTFDKLKNIVNQKSFWASLLGIILLAGAVNLVELLCSAGLPAIYTQVLALADLPRWQYYGYLAGYVFFYMLDDLLIFIAAMATLQMQAISAKYTRYSNLIGGVIILLIGILLIFKPGWLMFG